MSKRVLVTGAAGAIGRVVLKHLAERGHAVTGLDRTDGPGTWFTGSIQDPALVDQAVAGQDAVVHLAGTPDQADFLDNLLPNNVGGTYLILNAAVRHKVPRVIMASTLRVMAMYSKEHNPIRESDETLPHDEYSLSKVFCEDMGALFHRKHGLQVACARIGWFLRTPQEVQKFRGWFETNPGKTRSNYLSHDDGRSFFAAAVEAESFGFVRCFALSRNEGQTRFHCEAARQAFGWEPRDTFPAGTPAEVLGEN